MCLMFGHIIDIFWSHSNHVQNMTRPLDTSTFQKTISWCPKSVQSLGTFWTYFGHIMHIWTCFIISLSGVQNLSNLWTSFWRCNLTRINGQLVHFGAFDFQAQQEDESEYQGCARSHPYHEQLFHGCEGTVKQV